MENDLVPAEAAFSQPLRQRLQDLSIGLGEERTAREGVESEVVVDVRLAYSPKASVSGWAAASP
jgi:hypothetical protein